MAITIRELELYPAVHSIGITSHYSGLDVHTAVMEYRPAGGIWRLGIPLTQDDRATIIPGPGAAAEPNLGAYQWRGVIFATEPRSDYEVRVTYYDQALNIIGYQTGTIRTRNDNPAIGTDVRVVSLDGNDAGSGSEADPWRTLQHAVNQATPGMTTLMRGGVRTESIIILDRHGLPNNYITLMPFPGEEVILDGATAPSDTMIEVRSKYWRFKDFEIRGSRVNGILFPATPIYNQWSDECVVDGMTFRDFYGAGIQLRYEGGKNLIIIRSVFVNNINGASSTPILWWRPGWGVVIGYNLFTGLQGTRDAPGGIWDCVGGGPENDQSYTHEYDVYRNVCDAQSDDGYSVEGASRNLRVWENTIRGGFMGVAICPCLIGPVYITRNTSWNTLHFTKQGDYAHAHQYIYHNSIRGTQGPVSTNSGLSNVHIRNNIISASRYVMELGHLTGPADADYDLMYTSDPSRFVKWTGGHTYSFPEFQAIGQELHGQFPVQAAFVDAATGDLRLQPGSPGIDQGVILQGFNTKDSPWPYSEAAPDIGAIETGGTAPPPTADFDAEPISGPAPLTVVFNDESTGVIDTRVLDFGDGTIPSTELTPTNPITHIYEVQGVYTATLTVVGPGGHNSASLVINVSGQVISFTLTINSAVGGTTQPAAGSYPYPEGREVSVMATPDATHIFNHWDMNGQTVYSNPIPITMTENITLTPIFTKIITYTLTITSTQFGTTTPIPGTYIYNPGDEVAATATPNQGCRFVRWELNGQPDFRNPISVTMLGDTTLRAVFEQIPSYNLIIQIGAGGTTNPSAGVYNYTEGQEVYVMAIPSPGYVFEGWELNGQPEVDNPIKVIMTKDSTLAPLFSELVAEFNVTITTGLGGETNPLPGAYEVDEGEIFTVEAIAYTGYTFDHWEGDISSISKKVSFQVNQNMSIVAMFIEVTPPPPGPSYKPVLAGAGILGLLLFLVSRIKRGG